ncbi:MAG: Xaa-Pro peptidase family protein [Chloroflexota bacterium]
MSNLPFGRHRAKINANQTLSDDTAVHLENLDMTRIGLGPGNLALGEWQAKGLELPNNDIIRQYRLERVREKLRQFKYGGLVVSDPLNVRYATDSSNMQVWTLHNNVRYCFIATEGPVILFDFKRVEHLSAHLPLIDEVRPAKMWNYLIGGERTEQFAEGWAAEIADLMRQHAGGNMRLAIDRVNPEGLWRLEHERLSIQNGEEIMELARVIKHDEEIKAMRCAIDACESAMHVMQANLRPGMSEQELWSHLHAENIKRGGEWLETRLLASGPRTNPWYQECSSRIIENGDMVAFDTDLIGAYGICVDISRSWLCGDRPPTPEQCTIYRIAYDQIMHNRELPKAGLTFEEVSAKAKSLPPDYLPNRYTVLYHGVGLCDEYPSLAYKEDWDAIGTSGVFEKNMVVCVESYVGKVGGKEGVKLEEQLLITEDGVEVLSSYPFEEILLN